MPIINFNSTNLTTIADHIKNGGVCVLPTDTLYGISCTVLNKEAVEKIYTLKQRENEKPFIILVSSIKDIEILGIKISGKEKDFLEKNWPASLSVVIETKRSGLEYLHRGQNSLAFRMPDYPLLQELLKITGPITSTTINVTGQKPCESVAEAYNLFGDNIALYVDTGSALTSPPSTVIKFQNNQIEILRQGSYQIKH